MLVFNREKGDSISLFVEGREIKIILVESTDAKARIGIDALEGTLIIRSELIEPTPPGVSTDLLNS